VQAPNRLRSLRVKLTLWFALAFVGLQIALAVTVVAWRREAIRRSNVDRVERFAGRMADSLVTLQGEWHPAALAAVVPEDSGFVLAVVRRADGGVSAAWNVRDVDALPFTPWETVPAGPLGPVVSPIEGAPHLSVVTQPFRFEDRTLYLQAALPSAQLVAELGHLREMVWLVGVPALAVAFLIASRIAFRAVQPLDRMREAARGVTPESAGQPIHIHSKDAEVAALESEVNRALKRLADGYRAQEEFLANVSHELKSPIAVLRAEAQVVQRGRPDAAELRAFARSADEELRRLAGLVESLLVLTRTELAWERLRREALDVADLVLDSVRHCSALAETRAVRLAPRLPESDGVDMVVVGDRILLGTVLDNLVRNAVRFSPPGGSVSIRAEREGERVAISVSDEGPGVEPERLARIFERGEGGADREGERGLGLGLAIARSVSELHGGSIGVESIRGHGCTFVLRLPHVPAGPASA
jgi:signal transduction histidine kinase